MVSSVVNAGFAHAHVLVDYNHPYQILLGMRVSDLQASPPEHTRPIVQLHHPRCEHCNASISTAEIQERVLSGGDLHDPRFRWST